MAKERIFVGRKKELEQFKKIVGWTLLDRACRGQPTNPVLLSVRGKDVNNVFFSGS